MQRVPPFSYSIFIVRYKTGRDYRVPPLSTFRHCATFSKFFCLQRVPPSSFLVGAFLKKRARLLQSLVFFLFKTDSKRRTLKVKINVQLLKVLNYWTAKGKHGERIHSLFQRYIQARTGLKFRTPPLSIFFSAL